MKTLDVFSGCGGMSLGFTKAGFALTMAVDNWGPAINTYRQNFSHTVADLDLANFDSIEFLAGLESDVIIGGPPCQDFSIAGFRETEGKRANLTLSFADLISKAKPHAFVMEIAFELQIPLLIDYYIHF